MNNILNKLNSTRVKGYSLLETSVVLAVAASVAVGGSYKLNEKFKNDAVESFIGEMAAITQNANNCYDSGVCANNDKLIGGWDPDRSSQEYDNDLGLGVSGFANYKSTLDDKDAHNRINDLIIIYPGIKSDLGQRIAREMGLVAEYKDDPDNAAFGILEIKIASRDYTKGEDTVGYDMVRDRVQTEGLEFDEDKFLNVLGAGDVHTQRITLDGVEIDDKDATHLYSLRSFLHHGKECDYAVGFDSEAFDCVDPDIEYGVDPDNPIGGWCQFDEVGSVKPGHSTWDPVLGECYTPNHYVEEGGVLISRNRNGSVRFLACTKWGKRKKWTYRNHNKPDRHIHGPVSGHHYRMKHYCSSSGVKSSRKEVSSVACNTAYYYTYSCTY